MIELIFALLIAWSDGGETALCDLGTPLDWYNHELSEAALSEYARVRTADIQFDLYGDGTLFVYRDDMELGTDGHPHGACAVALP